MNTLYWSVALLSSIAYAAPNKATYVCPGDHLQTYTSTNGVEYYLMCGIGHYTQNIGAAQGSSIQDCAERCSKFPGCHSVDPSNTNYCNFKGDVGEKKSWNNGHSWYPVVCPKPPRLTAPNSKPAITTDISCPNNDGKIYEAADGTWFYNQCCAQGNGVSVLSTVSASGNKDCAEKCAADKKCKSFNYDLSSKTCKLFGEGSFSTEKETENFHYAYVVDPPTQDPKISSSVMCSTECPQADGQLYTGKTGENFIISCNKRHGTTYLKIDQQPNLEACLASCSTMPACHSADYEPRTQKCFHSNNHNAPAISASAFQSFHSLGCAGACTECAGCCGFKGNCKSANDTDSAGKPDDSANTILAADKAGCDDDHNKIISSNGENFRLMCRHCVVSTNRWSVPGMKSLAECAAACAKDPKCHAANYMPGVNGCGHHGAYDTQNTKILQLQRNAQCDALLPQSRSMPSFRNIVTPNPLNTNRNSRTVKP